MWGYSFEKSLSMSWGDKHVYDYVYDIIDFIKFNLKYYKEDTVGWIILCSR